MEVIAETVTVHYGWVAAAIAMASMIIGCLGAFITVHKARDAKCALVQKTCRDELARKDVVGVSFARIEVMVKDIDKKIDILLRNGKGDK